MWNSFWSSLSFVQVWLKTAVPWWKELLLDSMTGWSWRVVQIQMINLRRFITGDLLLHFGLNLNLLFWNRSPRSNLFIPALSFLTPFPTLYSLLLSLSPFFHSLPLEINFTLHYQSESLQTQTLRRNHTNRLHTRFQWAFPPGLTYFNQYKHMRKCKHTHTYSFNFTVIGTFATFLQDKKRK